MLIQSEQMPEARIQANRDNAQKSTGPRTAEGKATVSRNATKHGLSSKAAFLENAEEEFEFGKLTDSLMEDFAPVGIVEELLVQEIAWSWWQQRRARGWATRELQGRQKAVAALLTLAGSSALGQFAESPDSLSGLACKDLVISVVEGSKTDEEDYAIDFDVKPRVQFQARLGTSTETLQRYETAWKRDFYKALETLRSLQKDRKPKTSLPS